MIDLTFMFVKAGLRAAITATTGGNGGVSRIRGDEAFPGLGYVFGFGQSYRGQGFARQFEILKTDLPYDFPVSYSSPWVSEGRCCHGIWGLHGP